MSTAANGKPNRYARPRQRPMLMRGGLSGRVYIVTRYHETENGTLEADVKDDVTEDFDALVAALSGHYDGAIDAAPRCPACGWGVHAHLCPADSLTDGRE